ncbi:hypothetical protein [Alicyclobacillus herbarius]|uniref:hypothetical protein n=1 Tax=Alicyclobacillus herbarius TaxID=122960 RepID=UPI000405E7E1|nr:hypothetical protein [Alicyclobacillus herbarius]
MHTPTNGVPKGTIQNFTMLVGVYLSSVRQENAGNFTVWPGTHRIFEKYFREHGAESLLDGMPKVDMPKPLQLMVEPGDVVFAHYELAHAPNISPNVRYAIYFRVTHREFDRNHWQATNRIVRPPIGCANLPTLSLSTFYPSVDPILVYPSSS